MRTACLVARTIVAGSLVLLVAGCTQPSSSGGSSSVAPAGSTAAEQPASASSGGGGWMEGIPASVPPFEYGAFDKAQSSSMKAGDQTIYSLYYEGTKKEDVAAYVEKLKAAGFNITPDNAATGLSAAGELKKGDQKLIGLSISWQDSGHVDYTINVLGAAQ